MADGAILVRGVRKSFGGVDALGTIDLAIADGAFVTLFGPSGCGKSTLLRIMAGLLAPTAGSVTLFGQTPGEQARRKNIGWVPQAPALLPWLSVRDNAALATQVNRRADRDPAGGRLAQDADAMLARLGLAAFADALPAALSGGMRQRAAIARAFVQGASVMLMDEPFSGLDALTREAVRGQLLEVWQAHRKTVAFVTHSASEAVLLSDRVVVMGPRPGRILDIMDIGLERPRPPDVTATPRFAALVLALKQRLRQAAG